MRYLYCDTETFSPVPIGNGAHAYAEKAEVMLFAYAMGDDPVECIDLTAPGATEKLAKVKALIAQPDVMTVWHNSGFDRTVIRHALGIKLPLERVHDTMVQAYAHGLPGGLDKLCAIFKVEDGKAKLKTGKNYISIFCKPVRGKRNDRYSHPQDWEGFIQYAKHDILAMRELHRKLPMWNYQGQERALWELDQRINDRGFAVDTVLASQAIEAVDRELKRLKRATKTATDGEVESATKRAALLKYINEILLAWGLGHAVLPDLTSATIDRRLQDPDVPAAVKVLLALRQQSSTTSTSKYSTLMKAVSADGRLRGSLQFDGASRTGRWAGRLFQPQNLPRPKLKPKEVEAAIADIKAGIVDVTHDNAMEAISACVRGAIHAEPGNKLVVSDLSNIEGRVAAWLAGENWKLQAFTDFDTVIGEDEEGKPITKGPDLYKLAYAKSFGIPHSKVDKAQRQIGKVQELALQYEGGVGAFTTFADIYNIDLDKMGADAYPKIQARIRSEANSFWGFAVKERRTLGLAEQTFVVCDSLKRMWREAHPAISSYWKELESACIAAVRQPGRDFKSRRLTVRKDGAWLRIILPSGRSICYAGAAEVDGKLSYMGINQYSRKWERLKTYGGKLFENVTQAVSRDIMAANMPTIEAQGYSIILSVHDELLTETPDREDFNAGQLSALLSTNPTWAKGLPLAAAGYEAYNYKKD